MPSSFYLNGFAHEPYHRHPAVSQVRVAGAHRHRRSRLQMAHAAHGTVGICPDILDRLRTGARLAPGAPQVWLALSYELRLGSGQRAVWSFAFHFRNPGILLNRPSHRCASEYLHRRLPDRNRAALAAPGSDNLYRTAGGCPQRDSWRMGHLRDGPLVSRTSISLVA